MNEWILSSSVLILAMLLLRMVLRGRVSPGLQYALWGIVLVRLLVPVSFFSSALSVQNLNREMGELPGTQQQIQAESGEQAEQAVQPGLEPWVGTTVPGEAVVPEPLPPVAGQSQNQSGPVQSQPGPETVVPPGKDPAVPALTAKQWLRLVWVAGMALTAAVMAGCNAHFAMRLRKTRQPVDAPESPVEVYVTDVAQTPCLFGLFRPAVYLTSAAAGEETVKRYVLTHEITHYQHFDHIWAALRALCLVLHWYNPLVWLAARVSRQDGELACDDGTLELLGEAHRGDYGRTLIGMTVKVRFTSALVTSTTMTGGASAIRERIVILMKKPRTAMLTLIAVILACTLAVGCTFTGPVEKPAESVPGETTMPTGTDDPTAPPEHNPTPDMSEDSERLPIPDYPGVDLSVTNRTVTDDHPWFDYYRMLDGTGAGSNWYAEAMNHVYESALELDPGMLFYNGIYGGSWELLSEEETAVLMKQGFDRNRDLQLISRTALEGVLKDVFAVSSMISAENLPEGWVYLEQTDSFYANHNDAVGAHSFSIKGVEEMENGLIHITYQPTDGAAVYDNGQWVMDRQFVITLLPRDDPGGGYYVLANRTQANHLAWPVSRAEAPRASAEYEKYYDLLGYKPEGNWLNRAMSCVYADNREVDIAQFTACEFIGKAGWENMGDWDQMVLTGAGYDEGAPVHKITEFELNDAVLAAFKRGLYAFPDPNKSVYDSRAYYFLEEPNAGVKDFTITGILNLEDNQVRVYYVPAEGSTVTFQGEAIARRELAITLQFANDGTCHVLSNQLVLRNDSEGTALTEQQIEQVNEAFNALRLWEENGETHGRIYAIANFFTSCYASPEKIDFRAFMRYFSAYGVVNEYDNDVSEAEFYGIINLENWPFGNDWKYEDRDRFHLPIHKHPAPVVDAVLQHFMGIGLEDLEGTGEVLYSGEYDSFYTFTSDADWGVFVCTGGRIYDDHVELYSQEGNVLTLRKENGRYYIYSHLPSVSAP